MSDDGIGGGLCCPLRQWRTLEFQTRILFVCNFSSVLGVFMLVLAATTNRWVTFDLRTSSNEELVGHQGLWKISYYSMKQDYYYNYVLIHLFDDDYSRKIDHTITAFLRTSISFVGISFIMMVLANSFAVYALKHPRFTFKRVTGALYGMTTICLIVCLDMYGRILSTEEKNKKLIKYPYGAGLRQGYQDQTVKSRDGASTSTPPSRIFIQADVVKWGWGFSMILLVVVTCLYGIASAIFFVYSGKLKGARAPSQRVAEANEEYLIGRV